MPRRVTAQPRAHIHGHDRQKFAELIARDYDRGSTIRAIAAGAGRSYGFIHTLLHESGVTPRRRGVAAKPPP